MDDEDFDYLMQFRWFYNSNGYARRNVKKVDGTRTSLEMQVEIAKPPRGFIVDHINRNPLDNRRSNLRICTHSENRMNSGLKANNTSGYKGVSRVKNGWSAQITKNGKRISKQFPSIEEAVTFYNKVVVELYGEFAHLNPVNKENE